MKQQKQVIRRRSLFDHIKEVTSIQHKTYWKKLSEEDKKTWSNFMVHRFLSMNPNWLELTNEIQRYDLKPEMSAYEIRDAIVPELEKGEVDFVCLNFANGDMVGHTGNLEAAIKAIEVLDKCIHEIYKAIKKIGGQMIITADHGNAEVMMDTKNQQKHTQHTVNKVPFVYVGREIKSIKNGGQLSDIAPTILDLMNLPKPSEMTGKTLIIQDH